MFKVIRTEGQLPVSLFHSLQFYVQHFMDPYDKYHLHPLHISLNPLLLDYKIAPLQSEPSNPEQHQNHQFSREAISVPRLLCAKPICVGKSPCLHPKDSDKDLPVGVHIISAANQHSVNLKEKHCSCLLSTAYVKTLNLKQVL